MKINLGDVAGSGAVVNLIVNPDNTVTIIGLAGVTPLGTDLNDIAGSTYNPVTSTFFLNVKYFNSAGNLRAVKSKLIRL